MLWWGGFNNYLWPGAIVYQASDYNFEGYLSKYRQCMHGVMIIPTHLHCRMCKYCTHYSFCSQSPSEERKNLGHSYALSLFESSFMDWEFLIFYSSTTIFFLFQRLVWTTRDSSKPQVKWGTESGEYHWTKQVSDGNYLDKDVLSYTKNVY